MTINTDSVTIGDIVDVNGGDTVSTETTVFSVRMDASVKDSLDAFCADVGMNANTAINMFARVVAREKRLPFDVALDPFYDDRNIRHLLSIKADLESGAAKLTEHELIEVDDY